MTIINDAPATAEAPAKETTLTDILAALESANAYIIPTAEVCNRLSIGPASLEKLVADGLIKRIPHLRGRGGGHLYAVAEIRRFVEEGL